MAAVEDEVNELLDEDYDEKDEEEEEAVDDAPKSEEKDAAAQKEEGHTAPTGDEDLEAMKASLQGMEEEEAKLREMQVKHSFHSFRLPFLFF